MKVAVFSDTHGSLLRLPDALARIDAPDAFCHLGDFGSDAEEMAKVLPVPHFAVRGNCDALSLSHLPNERIVEFGGARLLLLHGHRQRSVYEMADLAERKGCGAVLFGHTHQPLLMAQGSVLILNPGSLTQPRGGSRPSFALLTIEQGDINAKLISL